MLDGIDLDVKKGETLTILGRSGSGKSVLLKLIIGLQKPDSGSIRIGDAEVTGMASDQLDEIRKKIGFLFQYSALYDSLTVEETWPFHFAVTLGCPIRAAGAGPGAVGAGGNEEAAAKMPGDIGGMKKRVGLARALAMEPELMLMDEPTAGWIRLPQERLSTSFWSCSAPAKCPPSLSHMRCKRFGRFPIVSPCCTKARTRSRATSKI